MSDTEKTADKAGASAQRSVTLRLFLILLIVGTIISTLGSVSIPIGGRNSSFWPGVVVQALGGLWFGWIGVAVGVLFPIISRTILRGQDFICYVPVNLCQALLPLLFYRHFRREPAIKNPEDFIFYAAFGCVAPGLVAGLTLPLSFYVFRGKEIVWATYTHDALKWAFIQTRTLLLIGVPLMIWFAPKVVEASLIPMYWSRNTQPGLQRSLAVKIFVAFGLVTIFPLTILGAYQVSTLNAVEILRPNFLAIALNVTFFSLLVVSAVLSDVLYEAVRDNVRRLERANATQEVAAQVAHDIQSPLAALEFASGDAGSLPQDRRALVTSAVERIREISESLKMRGQAEVVPCRLPELIEPLIDEKRLEYGTASGVEIETRFDPVAVGRLVKVNPSEFKRILSNLINNAVQARKDRIKVAVSLTSTDGHVIVTVADDGKGIEPEVLGRLGKRGETYGKRGGSGLGLYPARTCAESWGGKLEIESGIGRGTKVSLLLRIEFEKTT